MAFPPPKYALLSGSWAIMSFPFSRDLISSFLFWLPRKKINLIQTSNWKVSPTMASRCPWSSSVQTQAEWAYLWGSLWVVEATFTFVMSNFSVLIPFVLEFSRQLLSSSAPSFFGLEDLFLRVLGEAVLLHCDLGMMWKPGVFLEGSKSLTGLKSCWY